LSEDTSGSIRRTRPPGGGGPGNCQGSFAAERRTRRRAGAPGAARGLRKLDRGPGATWPDEAPTSAPLYARMLALEDRDWVAARACWRRALQFGPDPEREAMSVVRSGLGNNPGGAASMQETWAASGGSRRCAVGRARQVVCDGHVARPGWVGLSANLEFCMATSVGPDASDDPESGADGISPADLCEECGPRPTAPSAGSALKSLQGERLTSRDGVPWRAAAEARGPISRSRPQGKRRRRAGPIRWASRGGTGAKLLELCLEDDDGHGLGANAQRLFIAAQHRGFSIWMRRSELRGYRFRIRAAADAAEGIARFAPAAEAAVRVPLGPTHRRANPACRELAVSRAAGGGGPPDRRDRYRDRARKKHWPVCSRAGDDGCHGAGARATRGPRAIER